MNKKRNLIIATLVLGSFFVSHALVVQSITNSAQSVAKGALHGKSAVKVRLPDFAAITDVKARKKAFFNYLKPLVEAENKRLRLQRKSLKHLSSAELTKLADTYGIAPDTPDLRGTLAKHIDEIPLSLVLAQAAIESAWGTSRFAQTGNNLFGQWCFSKGCGMVPRSRAANANHEVRWFDSPEASVRSYMRNLNRHRAYRQLRDQRAQQRTSNVALNGCDLAAGLGSYSEKGMSYVKMVRSIIRNNQLESNKAPCKVMQKSTAKASKPPSEKAAPTSTAEAPKVEAPKAKSTPKNHNNDSA